MVFNVLLQLCKITRSSKLFQRNFYLPLLKPLSPKDALRKKIITGQNVLGKKYEHYIPVFDDHETRALRRKYRVKGQGKKRQRKKEGKKYVMPFFEDDMENHSFLQNLIRRQSKGRGQCYTYYVPDKDCTLVLTHQFERAIREKEIIDIMMAQRSEKIVVILKSGMKISMPIASYDGKGPLYRGEGWTKADVEDAHHHGKETFSVTKLFEAKEAGIEDWELEMMRLANKRKRKVKGEGTVDWKEMIAGCVDNMDWDKFEEDTKQIVEEINDPVEDEPIPMVVDDMEKTRNVNEKLKSAGEEVLKMLPVMKELPELIKSMQGGNLTEIASVSGMSVTLQSTGKECFIPGQIVKSDEGEVFVPGQTVENEDKSEYTPGFTVFMDNEPTLLPGLVLGDDPSKPLFLPGESTITQSGELQFVETEDDIRKEPTPPESEDDELDEDQDSAEEEEERKPPPPPPKKEFVYERPKRIFPDESQMPKKKEKRPKKVPKEEPKEELPPIDLSKPIKNKFDPNDPVLYDLTLPTFEKEFILQEKERVENFTEKKSKEELKIDRRKKELKQRAKEIVNQPPPPKYKPLDPVKKSEKLKEFEKQIRKGKFFDVDHKKFLVKTYEPLRVSWAEPFVFGNTFDSVGLKQRHLIWKSVY